MLNNKKAIVYLRKSTDREDKQQISIETQRQYCLKLAENNNITTYIIEEHKSAKDELKRPGFKQMLNLCKKGGYDYIIAYDPTRISRNTIDAAHFTELINKGYIKGFYAAESGQFFNGIDIFSALMLGISFLISKVDNQMRSSNTRKKMETYFKEGRIMGTTPFGYKNHQYFDESGRIQKDIVINEKEAELVNIAFNMRKDGALLRDISDYFKKNGYEKKNTGAIDAILKNTFYIGIQKGKLGEAEIKTPGYRPIISCQLFEKVNNLQGKLKKTKKLDYEAFFRGMLFNENGVKMLAYETKNKHGNKYIYYRNLSHIKNKLNISQKKIFNKIDDYILSYNFNENGLDIFEKLLKKEFFINNEIKNEKMLILDELKKIEKNKNTLSEKLIGGIVDDDTYKSMIVGYMKQKKVLEEKLSNISDDSRNINTLIKKGVELVRNVYFIYKNSPIPVKVSILKKFQVELFMKEDFSLKVNENLFITYSKNFLSCFGIPDKDRTCV